MALALVITIHGFLTVGIIGAMVVITIHGAGTIGDLDTVIMVILMVMVSTILGIPLIIMDMAMEVITTDTMETDTMATDTMATEVMPIIEVEEAITIIIRLPITVR